MFLRAWQSCCSRPRRTGPAAPALQAGFLSLPEDFLVGAATAAYQIEGAAAEGGRKPSIWDVFAHTEGKVASGATGDVACDHYHRFLDDVNIMQHLGLHAYRFSISWSRLLPDGNDVVNPEGAKFYSDLIDALQSAGITPWVTLYHFDLPEALEDSFAGWLGPKERIVSAFGVYARTCFRLFGDRVKHWITLNEPWTFAIVGYQFGMCAPGIKRAEHEMYTVGHNALLAHAEAARIYREEFRPTQGGILGMSNCMNWMQPEREGSPEDCEAARRRTDFMLGWFADPLYLGDYPASMRDTCGERLPKFTEQEKSLLKGSCDFFGLNSYSSALCSPVPEHREMLQQNGLFYAADIAVRPQPDPTWEITGMKWPIVPWGLRELLLYIQRRYSPPGGIVITELGCVTEPDAVRQEDERGGGSLVPQPYSAKKAAPEDLVGETLEDPERVRFFRAHLSAVHAAIAAGADVRGLFAWSLLDNFEWAEGYKPRFGIVRVDYATQRRTIKASGRFLAGVASQRGFEAPHADEQYAGLVF